MNRKGDEAGREESNEVYDAMLDRLGDKEGQTNADKKRDESEPCRSEQEDHSKEDLRSDPADGQSDPATADAAAPTEGQPEVTPDPAEVESDTAHQLEKKPCLTLANYKSELNPNPIAEEIEAAYGSVKESRKAHKAVARHLGVFPPIPEVPRRQCADLSSGLPRAPWTPMNPNFGRSYHVVN